MKDLQPFGCLTMERTLAVMATPTEILTAHMLAGQDRTLTEEEQDESQLAIDILLIKALQGMGLTYDEAVTKITDDSITSFTATVTSDGDLTIDISYQEDS